MVVELVPQLSALTARPRSLSTTGDRGPRRHNGSLQADDPLTTLLDTALLDAVVHHDTYDYPVD
ncbi:hypothetical protein ACTWPB_24035 [Nocardia sp. IBHARD005]|uniref:hypothetical protein n=1 Tax=Nocardia sp. IBHARD005 TaxID=3457765 RepID=UPI0040599303